MAADLIETREKDMYNKTFKKKDSLYKAGDMIEQISN